MSSEQAKLVAAKLKEIFGEVPQDLKQRFMKGDAEFAVFLRGIATQIDSHGILICIAAETRSPIIALDMEKLVRDVATELLKPIEVAIQE